MRPVAPIIALLGLIAAAASAHHSFAMFDASKTVTLVGTFKKAELINPHSWFWIVVPNDQGGSDLWGAEGGGPASGSTLAKAAGMSIKDYFAPGQKVTMTLHPLKDGRMGGQLVSLKFEDGRVYEQNTTTNNDSNGDAGR
jgi:hypothetical protein